MSRASMKVRRGGGDVISVNPVLPNLIGDMEKYRVKTYDSKLRKVMSEQWPIFASYPKSTQDVFLDFVSKLPDPGNSNIVDLNSDSNIVTAINMIFQLDTTKYQTLILDFVHKYRDSQSSQLNIYLPSSSIQKLLAHFYGDVAATYAPIIEKFFEGLQDNFGQKYFDVNDLTDIIELVNLIYKEQAAHPDMDFVNILNNVMLIISHIYNSGDHYIWSVPVMVEYEKRMEDNIRKEFATLEGIKLYKIDESGNRVEIDCNGCGGTWWVVPARMHRGRGDEIMHVKAICKQCGRPMGNV